MAGLPPVKALFFEFPDEPELFTVDRQWLIGSDILVTPVLTPGATTVDGSHPNLTNNHRRRRTIQQGSSLGGAV